METVTQVTEAASGSPVGSFIGLVVFLGVVWVVNNYRKTGKWPLSK